MLIEDETEIANRVGDANILTVLTAMLSPCLRRI